MIWLKKNWFKVGILIAVFSVVYLFYYSSRVNQAKESIKTENDAVNFSNIDAIPPDQALRTAFNESLQQSAMADIAELSCFPSSRYECNLEGCTPAAPTTYYFVDYGTDNGTYFRCDAKGCDSYPVKVVLSGNYTQFVPSLGQAMLFKVAGGDLLDNKGEFVDVATLGTTTLISFGKCELSK